MTPEKTEPTHPRDLDTDILVIGAGVVGCAIAAHLAATQPPAGHSLLVVERNEAYGRETTSHNSGVVHAGIYYPTGSLKHQLCIEGNSLLYEWCADHNVPIRRCGKLIVALGPHEEQALDALYLHAHANQVPGVERISGAAARKLEPAVPALAGLHSRTSGVVDSIALTRSFEAAARDHGALFVYRHEVTAATREGGNGGAFRVQLRDDDGVESELRCGVLINASGHGAPALAAALGYDLEGGDDLPRLRQGINRGRWYDIVGGEAARAVSRLVYPLPDHGAGGLGVHLTLDIDGALHLGPDSAWLPLPGNDALPDPAHLDYRTDDMDAEARANFLAAGQRLLPMLRDQDLAPGQVGYRPKLQRPGEPMADFVVWHDRGYVHLGGIESPGLTCSLSLARHVATLL